MAIKFGLVLIMLGMTVFGFWRYQVGAKSHSVAQFEFIQDASDSIATDCDRTTGLVNRALAMPETGSGSTITLLALGDGETANEPRWLGNVEIPVIRRVIEGQRATARARENLIKDVRTRCERVKQTRVSPIFEGLKRGVQQLQTVGASSDSRYLFIQTDGEETENKQIKQALNQAPGIKLKVFSPINNKGVHVTFCGVAETIGLVTDSGMKPHRKSQSRDSQRADRLHEVWSAVFSNPELVAFEPYCSRQ